MADAIDSVHPINRVSRVSANKIIHLHPMHVHAMVVRFIQTETRIIATVAITIARPVLTAMIAHVHQWLRITGRFVKALKSIRIMMKPTAGDAAIIAVKIQFAAMDAVSHTAILHLQHFSAMLRRFIPGMIPITAGAVIINAAMATIVTRVHAYPGPIMFKRSVKNKPSTSIATAITAAAVVTPAVRIRRVCRDAACMNRQTSAKEKTGRCGAEPRSGGRCVSRSDSTAGGRRPLRII